MKQPSIYNVFLALIASCAPLPALLPHEALAGRAVKRAWEEKGMPAPTVKAHCAVDEYQVIVTKTPEEYRRYCPTSEAAKSAGCLSWEESAHWFAWRHRPVVIVSMIHYSEPTIVVHELLHAYVQCSKLHPDPWDPGDRQHSDPRVWTSPGGADAVQTRADALCKEPPW